MSAAHFPVIGALDRGGGRYQRGTVTIDRESGTMIAENARWAQEEPQS